MGNMSYCRFENTSNDMADCIDALEEIDWNFDKLLESASSKFEKHGMKEFVEQCRLVAEVFEDLDLSE